MKIAYRRMSGAIGTSQLEDGTRGLWLEKRRALVRFLRTRGHTLHYVNRMTKFSQQPTVPELDGSYDFLMVEFGSNNAQFYGEDLAKTVAMVKRHRGRAIFLCDDPDLPYLWDTLPPERAANWCCWYNSIFPQPFGGQPAYVPSYDMPFAALGQPLPPTEAHGEHVVYVGRPTGRTKQVEALVAAEAKVRFYARPKEYARWPQLEILPPPPQAQRPQFYARSLLSLVLADAKHKRLRWRTGRGWHAVLAGCPAVSEEDHNGMAELGATFANPAGLESIRRWMLDPRARERLVKQQQQRLLLQRDVANATAQACGL